MKRKNTNKVGVPSKRRVSGASGVIVGSSRSGIDEDVLDLVTQMAKNVEKMASAIVKESQRRTSNVSVIVKETVREEECLQVSATNSPIEYLRAEGVEVKNMLDSTKDAFDKLK